MGNMIIMDREYLYKKMFFRPAWCHYRLLVIPVIGCHYGPPVALTMLPRYCLGCEQCDNITPVINQGTFTTHKEIFCSLMTTSFGLQYLYSLLNSPQVKVVVSTTQIDILFRLISNKSNKWIDDSKYQLETRQVKPPSALCKCRPFVWQRFSSFLFF